MTTCRIQNKPFRANFSRSCSLFVRALLVSLFLNRVCPFCATCLPGSPGTTCKAACACLARCVLLQCSNLLRPPYVLKAVSQVGIRTWTISTARHDARASPLLRRHVPPGGHTACVCTSQAHVQLRPRSQTRLCDNVPRIRQRSRPSLSTWLLSTSRASSNSYNRFSQAERTSDRMVVKQGGQLMRRTQCEHVPHTRQPSPPSP